MDLPMTALVIYDLNERRWLRVYGDFPDERAIEQAKQAPAAEEPSASPEQADLQPQKEESLPPPPKRPRRERITFTPLHPEIPRISAMISISPMTPWAMAPPARNTRPMSPLSAP